MSKDIDLKKLGVSLSRRRFLQTSAAVTGAASMGLSFAPGARAANGNKTLVYVFLRGGLDGLSMLPPVDGSDYGHYMTARDRTRLDINASEPGDRPLPLSGSDLGFHPYCSGLLDIYNQGDLAVIQAAGHPEDAHTRSHFDAQEQIELGQPINLDGSGTSKPADGWLTRYLQTAPGVPATNAVFTAMVSSSTPPLSLGGYADVATLDSPDSFHPNAGLFGNTHLATLASLYSGAGELDLAAGAALDAVDLINSIDLDNYVPGGGASYENTGPGRDFKLIAQLIRQNLGIAVATVDVGGWDTHNNQNVLNFNGGFGGNLRELSDALTAFFRDLEGVGCADDVAVVVQSEFGRQVKENANYGTDHGLGNPMLVIGGGVQGGQVYGNTLGIAPADRIGDSLRPMTDFRQVLAEVSAGLLGNNNVNTIFNDTAFNYQPLGFS